MMASPNDTFVEKFATPEKIKLSETACFDSMNFESGYD